MNLIKQNNKLNKKITAKLNFSVVCICMDIYSSKLMHKAYELMLISFTM